MKRSAPKEQRFGTYEETSESEKDGVKIIKKWKGVEIESFTTILCFILSAVCMIGYLITRDPIVADITKILIGALFGSLPGTVKKSKAK